MSNISCMLHCSQSNNCWCLTQNGTEKVFFFFFPRRNISQPPSKKLLSTSKEIPLKFCYFPMHIFAVTFYRYILVYFSLAIVNVLLPYFGSYFGNKAPDIWPRLFIGSKWTCHTGGNMTASCYYCPSGRTRVSITLEINGKCLYVCWRKQYKSHIRVFPCFPPRGGS